MAKNNLGLKDMFREADPETRARLRDGLPYQTGWGKPPTHTQFKPGNRSGQGRRRGSRNLHTVVNDVYNEKISVTKKGKSQKVTRKEVIVEQVANQGCAGDLKAAAMSLELLSKTGELSSQQTVEAPALEPRDYETVQLFADFLKGATGSQNDDDEG
jgi:hypothetical protein